MSFNRLKKEDLAKVAEEFGVDVEPGDNKDTIVAALVENGVTWDMAKKFDKTVAEEAAVVEAEVAAEAAVAKAAEPPALLFMDRENSTYEIRGYTFTKEHPFAIVAESDAEFIVETVEGFRYATPKEAQVYYG